VAVGTKRHEIILLVVTEVTSVLNVVDLKVLQATALLATPAISTQYPFPESLVRLRIEPQPWKFRAYRSHKAIRNLSRSSAFIASGRKSRSRDTDIIRISGFPSLR
jgi:hypothetical protein